MSYKFFKYDHDGNITHVRAWIAYLLIGAIVIVWAAALSWAVSNLFRLFV